MKILMLTHFFAPRIGGVEKVVEELAKHLEGYEVVIIAEKHDSSLKDIEKYNKWTHVYRISYPHKKYIGLLSIWWWLFKNRNLILNSDIVHVHDVFIWYLPLRFLFPFKPVYMTFHGWEGIFPIPFTSLVQKKLAYYLSKKTMVVGKHLEKYNRIKADLISYNGTDVPRKQSKKALNSFVYVGRLSTETGLHLVLQILGKIKNIHIEFCGDGELREECEQFGKVHGFVRDVSPFLAKAEYCFAGGILNIQEALAHKCVTLVMYQNQIKEDYFKIAPFAEYIVIENSPEKMVDKIQYYQEHKEKKKEIIAKGYEWVKGNTWEKLTDQYKQLWGIEK